MISHVPSSKTPGDWCGSESFLGLQQLSSSCCFIWRNRDLPVSPKYFVTLFAHWFWYSKLRWHHFSVEIYLNPQFLGQHSFPKTCMTVVPAKAYKAFWHRARRTKLMRSCTVWSALGCVLIILIFNFMMSNESVSLWSVAYDNVPVFYSKWWVVEKLFFYEDLRFYLWRYPTSISRSQNARYRVHRATRVLYVRSGIDDQNLTRHQTDACKGTEEGRWIGCYIIWQVYN